MSAWWIDDDGPHRGEAELTEMLAAAEALPLEDPARAPRIARLQRRLEARRAAESRMTALRA